MAKNINTLQEENLLRSEQFKSLLGFEANYGSVVRGGHYPYYFSKEKTERLVSNVNILTSKEQQELAYNLFHSKN